MRTSSRAETATTAPVDGTRLHTVRLVLPVLAGVAAAYVLWRIAAETSAVPPRVVLAAVPIYLALWLATIVLHAYRWRIVLTRLGGDVPLARLTQLWLAARAVGALVPSASLGGEPVRMQLLVAHGLPAARAAGVVALDRSLELAGNMIVGPMCIAGALALGAGSGSAMTVAAFSGVVGTVFLAAIYVRGAQGRPALVPILAPPLLLVPARWRARLHEHLAHVDRAMRETLVAHPGLVPAGLAVSLAIEALHIVELIALFAVFALAVPFPLVLLSSMGIGVAHAIPVSAALGTLEATQVGLFTVGGEPLATGLAVAVALRLAETWWILVGLACLATAARRRPAAAQ